MKQQDCLLKFRFLVFVAAVVFMAAGCEPVVVPEPKKEPPPIEIGDGPQESMIPISFYLTNDYEPANTDTGKTAFNLKSLSGTPKNIAGISESLDNNIVVRFLDGKNGIAVSMYFSGSSNFPNWFVLNKGEYVLFGGFSPYSAETQKFSLVLSDSGGGKPYLIENIALNKNVFKVYQNDTSLNFGQNIRIQNFMYAASIWTAVTLRFDTGSAGNEAQDVIRLAGSAVKSFSAAFFGMPDAVLPEKAIENVNAPGMGLVAVFGPMTVTVEQKAETVEESKAPRFELYYLDESKTSHPVPVLRDTQTPLITQEFYVKPNGKGLHSTSNVRFYYTVSAKELTNDEVAVDFTVLPNNFGQMYELFVAGKEAEKTYFEVKKRDGFRASYDRKTKLAITVFNKSASSKAATVYFPCYYVNGAKFEGAEGFTINFLDSATPEEMTQVLIPEHSESSTPMTYDVSIPDVIFPSNNDLLNMAAIFEAAAAD
jgi:hypothetical protein